MSIEEKINAITRSKCGPVELWKWTENDKRRVEVDWMRDFDLSEDEKMVITQLVGDPFDLADEIILSASTAECLTSNSEYIRERKRFSLKEFL